MKISEKGINLIKSFEGCRLESYKCPAGVWTIGYGHTMGVKQGQVITQEQAEEFLRNDLIKYEEYVTNNAKIQLEQCQFDALVSFTYNCGVGNLRSLLKNRTHHQIAEALLLYNKANKRVLTGLTRRRKAEKALFLSVEESTVTIQYYANCMQSEVGIVSGLKSIGVDSSYLHRGKIAIKNGIVEYKGTAKQNVRMLELLKAGKLIKV